jgi:hypothetical protein
VREAAQGKEPDSQTGLASPGLTKEYIQARVREDFIPLARACYESALAKAPALAGHIIVNFTIVGAPGVGGIVDEAEINDRTDITDREFLMCMRESMLTMVFEAPQYEGWTTVVYPFEFAPD